MIFGHTLAECQKAVAAFLGLCAAVVSLYVSNIDPNFWPAVTILAGAIFGVIAVFCEKNLTADHLAKAVVALIGAGVSVVTFFITVDPNVTGRLIAIALAAVTVFAVWRRENVPARP
jgi:peptidoglycan/LPS O-acetylase OafA/YrhL